VICRRRPWRISCARKERKKFLAVTPARGPGVTAPSVTAMLPPPFARAGSSAMVLTRPGAHVGGRTHEIQRLIRPASLLSVKSGSSGSNRPDPRRCYVLESVPAPETETLLSPRLRVADYYAEADCLTRPLELARPRPAFRRFSSRGRCPSHSCGTDLDPSATRRTRGPEGRHELGSDRSGPSWRSMATAEVSLLLSGVFFDR